MTNIVVSGYDESEAEFNVVTIRQRFSLIHCSHLLSFTSSTVSDQMAKPISTHDCFITFHTVKCLAPVFVISDRFVAV